MTHTENLSTMMVLNNNIPRCDIGQVTLSLKNPPKWIHNVESNIPYLVFEFVFRIMSFLSWWWWWWWWFCWFIFFLFSHFTFHLYLQFKQYFCELFYHSSVYIQTIWVVHDFYVKLQFKCLVSYFVISIFVSYSWWKYHFYWVIIFLLFMSMSCCYIRLLI